MLTQSKAAQRAAGDPWSATALRAHLEGLWTPKPQGFSSATELGCSWDAALAAAKAARLAQSQGRVTPWD